MNTLQVSGQVMIWGQKKCPSFEFLFALLLPFQLFFSPFIIFLSLMDSQKHKLSLSLSLSLTHTHTPLLSQFSQNRNKISTIRYLAVQNIWRNSKQAERTASNLIKIKFSKVRLFLNIKGMKGSRPYLNLSILSSSTVQPFVQRYHT